MDMRLRAPFTMLVAGPTGSGKTVLVSRLIEHASALSDPPPSEIIYCYDEWQSGFEPLSQKVTFKKGVPDDTILLNDGRHRWIIVDDLMDELLDGKAANELFTKKSHHRKISVVFIVQNLFHKNIRTVSVNTHYMFIAKSPRDATSVLNIAKQAFPGRTKYVMEAYRDATKRPHSFLLIDMRQETDDDARLIANYPPTDDNRMVVYAPKGL